MIDVRGGGDDACRLDAGVRSAVFQKIMDDLDLLLKRIENCPPDSEEFHKLDDEIRLLLLKEIQVIIDDYVLSKKSGRLDSWKRMYGDIDMYIGNFYRYRQQAGQMKTYKHRDRYGFFKDSTVP